MNKTLVTLLGPTAIGKTSKSIALAQTFSTEIISADSRQLYKEMEIGTAVPSSEELAAVPHHFIQQRSIFEDYSVGDFEAEALQVLAGLFRDHQIVFMVGGSGLYLDAVQTGLNTFPKVTPAVREELNTIFQEKGLEPLQQKLQKLDPEQAEKMDLGNPHRVIRALEICTESGKTYSSFLKKPKKKRDFENIKIGLKAPREMIYKRIEQRVDLMIEAGLLEEAEQLFKYKDYNALNTVGYKELFHYFEGNWELDFAISEIKKNTRRFAKRQLTWFRKDKDINWFSYDTPAEEIVSFIVQKTTP